VLKRLELCVPVDSQEAGSEGSFIFPGLLDVEEPDGAAFKDTGSPSIWVGRRLRCNTPELVLPTSFLPRLQVRLRQYFSGAMPMWMSGVTIICGHFRARVELSSDRRELDVAVQGPNDDGKRPEAVVFMNEVVGIVARLQTDVCSHVNLEVCALSGTALAARQPQSARWAYPVTTLRERHTAGRELSDPVNADVGPERIVDLLDAGGTTPPPELTVLETLEEVDVTAPPPEGDLPTAVSLQCPAPGATMRYTLDGTDVNETSKIHEGGEPLTQTRLREATVMVRAFCPGSAPSPTIKFQLWRGMDVDTSSNCSRSTSRASLRLSHSSLAPIVGGLESPSINLTRINLVVPYSSSAGASDNILREVMGEIRNIDEILRGRSMVDYALESRLAHDCPTWDALRQLLQRVKYAMPVHRATDHAGLVMLFVGHGSDGQLVLDNGDGIPTAPDIDDIALKIAECNPACVILNACDTYRLGRAVKSHCSKLGNTEVVVCCWSSNVSNRAAAALSTHLIGNVVDRLDAAHPGQRWQGDRRELYQAAAMDAWNYIRGCMNDHHERHSTGESAWGPNIDDRDRAGIPPVRYYCRFESNRFCTLPQLGECAVPENYCYDNCWFCSSDRASGGSSAEGPAQVLDESVRLASSGGHSPLPGAGADRESYNPTRPNHGLPPVGATQDDAVGID